MTNREKYAEQILDIACSNSGIGIDKQDMTPTNCWYLNCSNCYFHDFRTKSYESCYDMRKEWWNEEYTEPPVDWSKVPVDTPILVRDSKNDEWKRRYFSVFRNGAVYAWKNGRTSWSAHIREDFEIWEYAKLAEDEA